MNINNYCTLSQSLASTFCTVNVRFYLIWDLCYLDHLNLYPAGWLCLTFLYTFISLYFYCRILGHSGQPVSNIKQYSKLESSVDVMQKCLNWCHMAPTAPDTLGTNCTLSRHLAKWCHHYTAWMLIRIEGTMLYHLSEGIAGVGDQPVCGKLQTSSTDWSFSTIYSEIMT